MSALTPTSVGRADTGLPAVDAFHQKLGAHGQRLRDLGVHINALLKRYLRSTTRSKTLSTAVKDLFPLPLEICKEVDPQRQAWLEAMVIGLNELNGSAAGDAMVVSEAQKEVGRVLRSFLDRVWTWDEVVPTEGFGTYFDVKGVDYRGEEIRLARSFTWECIAPSLPQEVGTLQLEDFCSGGCLDYIRSFENYLVPPELQVLGRTPRIMVEEHAWDRVCQGLIESGICGVLPVEDLYTVSGRPLLNGLFAVGKNEFVNCREVCRLIMNLVPLNRLCRPIQGDTGTMPTIANFSSFYLEEGEVAMLGSEDIKCFYYLFQVPPGWRKYLGFAREVAQHLLPPELKGRVCHLVSLVLPMGFINSVGLAQHIHRNVCRWSAPDEPEGWGAQREMRRDRPATVSKEIFRIYLDNWDGLRKVDRDLASDVEGKPSAHQLALRAQYEELQLPRHPKKSVEGGLRAEVQGAIFDGQEGVAYAKPSKVLKYVGLTLELLDRGSASQRELQVVAGGMVYITMFRRALLCSLNAIWRQIEDLKQEPPVVRRPIPFNVQAEMIRFVALVPLGQMDFRATMHPQVTASDASTTGGGFCVTSGLTAYGVSALAAPVRGDIPEAFDYIQVLTIGLFDGIAALRVAADLLHLPMAGHVSVECNEAS